MSPQISNPERDVLVKRAAFAGFVGTFVEWFDYAMYGFLAAVIAVVFFPETDRMSGLIAAYALFSISFIARPIGGIIWGHFGDRIGRKKTLVASIAIMSIATFAIAFIPGYDSIALLAPILLLLTRLVQGFAASGEFAGAASLIAEYAPDKRRGLYVCLVPAGEAAGLLVASTFALILYSVLSEAQLHSWGWRIPFLFALPFGIIGIFIRKNIEETPRFRELEAKHHLPAVPVKELLQNYAPQVLIAFCGALINAVGFYIILIYMPTYLTNEFGVSEQAASISATVTLIIYFISIFIFGALSDVIGRKNMLLCCSACFVILSLPLFFVISVLGGTDGDSHPLMFVIAAALGLILSMNIGSLPSYLCELFPTRVRFSGFALSYNAANAFFGGTAPLLATWLGSAFGATLAPAWFLTIAAAITFVAILFSKAGGVHAQLEN